MNLFEIAAREKYRYPFKGSISTEDLWDLNQAQLDTVFKALSREARAAGEEKSITASAVPVNWAGEV